MFRIREGKGKGCMCLRREYEGTVKMKGRAYCKGTERERREEKEMEGRTCNVGEENGLGRGSL